MSRDSEPEVHEVFATIATDRAREEREAWVAFASAATPFGDWDEREICRMADTLLAEYRKRFPVGGAE